MALVALIMVAILMIQTRGKEAIVKDACVVVVSRLPPPGFELQISRLPGKGGYSTRPPGTTSSLIIWVES
jgi:hypothetical protein